jgi:hypothetical protein
MNNPVLIIFAYFASLPVLSMRFGNSSPPNAAWDATAILSTLPMFD